jgi:hypothetical protein
MYPIFLTVLSFAGEITWPEQLISPATIGDLTDNSVNRALNRSVEH